MILNVKAASRDDSSTTHQTRRRGAAILRRSTTATIEQMENRTLMTALAVWNFNDSTVNTANFFAVDRTATGVSASMSSNFTASNITSAGGTTVNADSGDSAGNALTLQVGSSGANNGKYITFTATTSNYGNIVVSFATQASSASGFTSDQFQYSTDGTTFTNFGSPYTPPTSFAGTGGTQSFNLSSISGLNDDASAAFRIIFSGGSTTSSSSNNRIDNLIVAGSTLLPAVSSVSPNSGDGTSPVTITGQNFTGATQVSFGSIAVPSSSFLSNTGTAISVNVPAGLTLNQAVDVTVTSARGTSATIGSAGQFTLTPVISTAPTVTGLSISSGPAVGGESVTITGTNFTTATNVSFGTTAASFTVSDSSHIVAVEPAGTASATPVDVTVTNSSAVSATNASDRFYYNAPTGSIAVTSSDTAIATTRTIAGTFAAENANYSISSVHFYVDLDKSGTVTVGDADLGTGTFNGSSFVLSFTPSQYNVSYGTQTIIGVATSTSTAMLTTSQTFSVASPQIQFNPVNYTVAENASSVTLTVTRTFDTTEPIQVAYSTADGSAHAGTDYTATTGTLNFPADPGAAGSTDSQTITVPLLSNPNTPGLGTFSVSLSGAVGTNASQGNLQITTPTATATATVSIQQITPRPFTAGDVVVYRVGDGSTALSSASTQVFLDEFAPGGSIVQSFPLQSTAGGGSGTNQPLTAAGTAAEGFLSVSQDGQYLLVPGYDAVAGTASIANTASSSVNREVAIISADGTVNTMNTFANWTTSGNPRSVASADGTTLYLGGSDSGIFRVVANNTTGQTASLISNTSSTIRTVNITGDNLYASTASGSLRITQVGSGLPTTSGQTMVNLPGISNVTSGSNTGVPSPYAFFLTSDQGTAPDTLYIADDTSGTGGIDKFSLVNGSWVLNNTIAASNVRGITGVQTSNGVTLYITSGGTGSTGGGKLYSLSDTSGYNASINGSLNTLATASTDEAYRGVAFVPVAVVSSLPAWVTSSGGASWNAAGNTLTVTGSATIVANPTAISPNVAPNIIVSGGSLSINPTSASVSEVDLASLNISAGSVAIAPRSAPLVLEIQAGNALTVAAGATLDLAGNYLDVTGGDLAGITSLVKSARNGAAWTGTGIGSSTARADAAAGNYLTGLGVIVNHDSADAQIYPTFDGVTAHAGDVLVRYTYVGDANISGSVGTPDYTLIDNAYLTEQSSGNVTGWYNGDFNFDSVVNGSDYTLLDNAFNTQGNPLAGATAQIAAPSPAPTSITTMSGNADSFFSRKKVDPSLFAGLEDLISAGD